MGKYIKINKIIILVFLSAFFSPLVFSFALQEPDFALIKQAEEEAQFRRLEAEKKAKTIDNYYNKGKLCYQKGDYTAAISNFEELLKIDRNYEPAKLYLQCAVIRYKLDMEEDSINAAKLQMANIVADYDRKIGQVEGLALGYLLEQALLGCQAGDFSGAEYYYNLCYKLDPKNEDKISWFVDATLELKDLYNSLNESYKRIEELSKPETLLAD